LVLGLRELELKEQYRSDRDDLISEFFVPCLSNCIEYDRCIEYVTTKSLTTLSLGFENFTSNKAKMRIITGHRFRTSDLNLLGPIFGANSEKTGSNGKLIRDKKITMLRQIVNDRNLEIKIAVPNSEIVDGSFAEKIGIFRDSNDDVVAFTGTSNETFNTQNKNFESIDVFTSWNDKSRVEIKVRDFENLWQNKTPYVNVYDFKDADRNSLLKYSAEWAVNFS